MKEDEELDELEKIELSINENVGYTTILTLKISGKNISVLRSKLRIKEYELRKNGKNADYIGNLGKMISVLHNDDALSQHWFLY